MPPNVPTTGLSSQPEVAAKPIGNPLAQVAGGAAFTFLNSFLQASGFTSPWLAHLFLAVAAFLTVHAVWAAAGRSWRLLVSGATVALFLVLAVAQEQKRAREARLEARAEALLPILEITPEDSESKVRQFLERMPWTTGLTAGRLPDMIWAMKLNLRSLPWSITISRPRDAPMYLTFAARVHWPPLAQYPAQERRRIRLKALLELARLKVLHEIDESATLNLHVKATYRISNLDEAQIVDAINLLRSAIEIVGYTIDVEGAPGMDSIQSAAVQ